MRIAIIAGEASGDFLGAGLIQSIKKKFPDAHFEGIAGPLMITAGCSVIEKSEALSVMGFTEPLAKIPKLLLLRRKLINRWLKLRPDIMIGIDSPDFNLSIEEALKRDGIPTIHYVSPSVWAWRKNRIKKIKISADKVLCLFPFEKDFYDEAEMNCDFVGHPMADSIPAVSMTYEARKEIGINTERVITVLPGSRNSEVSRLGSVFAETCALIARDNSDISFVAPMVNKKIYKIFKKNLINNGVEDKFFLLDRQSDLAIRAANVVLLASGTATLETALYGKPMVAAYRVSPLTYKIITSLNLLKVPYVTLPNLLTTEPLIPEFLQNDARPDYLSYALQNLLEDPQRCADIKDQFTSLRGILAKGANDLAAESVLSLLR